MNEQAATLPDEDATPLPYNPDDYGRDAIEDGIVKKQAERAQSLPTLDEAADQDAETTDEQTAEAGAETETQARDEQGRFKSDATQAEDQASSDGDNSRRYTLKINGQEQQYTEAELISMAQQSAAAQQKFQNAAAMLKQAQELQRQAQSQPQPQSKQPTPQQQGGEQNPIVRALMYGTEEEVAQAVQQLQGGGQSALDPTQVAHMAARMATEQAERQTALNTALTEFPEIQGDTRLQEVATSFYLEGVAEDLMGLGYTAEQLQSAPRNEWIQRHREARSKGYATRPDLELFRSAGTRTREWRAGGATPGQQSDGMADRQARKAGATPQPRAASAATPARGAPGPKTQAQIIAEEREARGLR